MADEKLTSASTKISAEGKGRRGRTVALVVVAGLLVLLGGVYLLGYFMSGDRVPRSTTVQGVEIGGLDSKDAEAKLAEDLAGPASAPLTLVVDGEENELAPADAGLALDPAATVEATGIGRSWNPVHIWRVLTGGGEVDPVAKVDQAALDKAVATIAEEKVDRDPKNAEVGFDKAKPTKVDGVTGRTLDRAAAAGRIKETYLIDTRVELPFDSADPELTTAAADAFIAEFAEKAVQGPVVVDTGKGTFEITPEMIAASIDIKPEGGEFKGSVNPDKLHDAARPAVDELGLKKPKDASYKFENGGIVVVPAVDGADVTKETYAEKIIPAITSDERKVTVELQGAKAKFSTEEAEKRKPREVIGKFTTQFPHADYRNTNLGRFAEQISGAVVRPGETFSVDGHVGPRNAAAGYVDGYVIEGGQLRKQSAGGISQGATTLYNAAWFAGLEDVEHQPHTLYFDRYPAGREATLYYGSIDLKFKNTTDNAILITGSVSQSSPGSKGSITFKIWGVKQWDIESPEPTKSGFYDGKTIKEDDPQCEPQSASPGFTASYYRIFKQNGREIRREDKSWQYSATDQVICV